MFKMEVEAQLNMPDRTLICGKPEMFTIPKTIFVDDIPIKVVGISCGVKPPYISLELEKTNLNLKGKTVTN